MESIRTAEFLSKISDVYFVIYNTLNIIKRPDVQKFIVNTMMQGTDKMLQELEDQKVFNSDDSYKSDELKKQIYQQLKELNAKKVQDYVPVLLNQNLVMLCTIMEIFFVHILEIIIKCEPKTLIGLSVEKEITLQRAVELSSYEAVIEEFESKTLEHFSRQGLKEKFKIYSKIGLDNTKIFDYSSYTDEAKGNLHGYDLNKLNEIFDMRHDIVHKNCSPLQELEQLNKIKDFFEKLIWNISTQTMKKFGILLDLQENLVKAGYPRDKIPVKKRNNENNK